MYKQSIFLLLTVFFISCSHKQDSASSHVTETNISDTGIVKETFFPVTRYLKGQLNEISAAAVNPLKFVTANNVTDSTWIKMEDLEKEAGPFLDPVIDTLNLSGLFTEKKFLDQTINAYTFTYDPSVILPDTFQLKHWDVYVDPVSNKVKRIYMVKNVDGKMQQLTWQSDKWCKVVTIATDANNKSFVEKEVLIKWDF